MARAVNGLLQRSKSLLTDSNFSATLRCRSIGLRAVGTWENLLYQKLHENEFEAQEQTRSSANGPSTWDTATELPRVLLEMTSLTYAWPLLNSTPRGDGHTVLVLPGFTAGDQSTLVLRRLLERRNYRALPWLLGQNTGSFELQDRLMTRFQAVLAEATGSVSLIGQSLGGVFARVLARQWPDRVRQVITLGSPFG